MRVVESEADFESQMDRAISRSNCCFGDGSVLSKNMWVQDISKFKLWQTVTVMYCIYSKRMQHPASSPKVIEEAPSSVLTPGA
jgi:propionyl-CoA carboxylase alpha chain